MDQQHLKNSCHVARLMAATVEKVAKAQYESPAAMLERFSELQWAALGKQFNRDGHSPSDETRLIVKTLVEHAAADYCLSCALRLAADHGGCEFCGGSRSIGVVV